MSPTEQTLSVIHNGPVARLKDICEQHLGSKYEHARQKAALHNLPIPTFKLDDTSQKSPWMVRISDLARHIDAQADAATAAWEKSQL